ncbi:MAG: HIT family protein [Candidatus Lindowbacteria bacterium]|nr:HIT family protein [Candidatus Lindowbacteria bacterium]
MKLPPDSPFHPIKRDQILLETDICLAFLDKYPVSEGHSLVIPKMPVISLYELDPKWQAEIWELTRRVRELLEERHHPDGFNIGINDGRTAGQTVPHAHVHVIPRYANDVPDPRGGIRWVIPSKAKYWFRKSTLTIK